jgi:hypothetical protein
MPRDEVFVTTEAADAGLPDNNPNAHLKVWMNVVAARASGC